jgi:hypothetical protein
LIVLVISTTVSLIKIKTNKTKPSKQNKTKQNKTTMVFQIKSAFTFFLIAVSAKQSGVSATNESKYLRSRYLESSEGWSDPVNNISFNSDTYSAVATCTTCAPNGIPLDPKGSTPIDGCCKGALCGVCTNDAWASPPVNVPGFINGLKQICHGLQDEISVGHGMYEGHKCGECVCVKCNSQSKGGCKSETPFLHMRQDDAYGSSNEVTTSFYNARWSAGGEQAVSFYEYKKVSSCDITLCD